MVSGAANQVTKQVRGLSQETASAPRISKAEDTFKTLSFDVYRKQAAEESSIHSEEPVGDCRPA